MAAKTSKVFRSAGSSLVQQTSLQALLPPVPPPALTLKDLQDAFGKHSQLMSDMMDEKLKKLEEKMEEKLKKLEKKMEEKFRAMRVDMLSMIESVAECVQQLDEKVEDLSQKNSILEAKVLENENIRDKMDGELSLVQYHQMQYAIRIRGLKENCKEDLKQLISEALEGVLGQPASEIEGNMDKIFRVNSWIARQRKIPRDVVVYFTKRVIRDEVIQAAYDTKLVVAEQVLKEIPPKILRRRKDFAFLVQELKKCDIKFRWEIPVGLVVTHEGKRHRLVTVAQARDFYSNVLKATPLSSLEAAKEYGQGKLQDVADRQTEDNGVGGDQVTGSSVVGGGQRMTRAVLRSARQEQEQDQQKVMESPKCTYSEVEEGARSNEIMGVMSDVLQKFWGVKIGKILKSPSKLQVNKIISPASKDSRTVCASRVSCDAEFAKALKSFYQKMNVIRGQFLKLQHYRAPDEDNIQLLRLFTERQSHFLKDFGEQLESSISKLKNDVALIVKKKREARLQQGIK